MVRRTLDDMIAGQIQGYIRIRHTTAGKVCESIGRSRGWWAANMKTPSEMSVKDLSAIYIRLAVPKEERIYDLPDGR